MKLTRVSALDGPLYPITFSPLPSYDLSWHSTSLSPAGRLVTLPSFLDDTRIALTYAIAACHPCFSPLLSPPPPHSFSCFLFL